jgi:hypothetical protein
MKGRPRPEHLRGQVRNPKGSRQVQGVRVFCQGFATPDLHADGMTGFGAVVAAAAEFGPAGAEAGRPKELRPNNRREVLRRVVDLFGKSLWPVSHRGLIREARKRRRWRVASEAGFMRF